MGNSLNMSFVIQILAFSIYVASPLIYLAVALLIPSPSSNNFENVELLQWVFLFLSLVIPLIGFAIKKLFIRIGRNGSKESAKLDLLFLNGFILTAATVEAVYIFGMMIFFLSGDIQRLLYFYPIGIVWTFIFWPTRDRYQNFLEEIKKP